MTYRNLLTLRSFNELISKSTDNRDLLPVLQLSRLVNKFKGLYEQYDEAVEDLRLDHCYKDGDRIVRDDKGNYQWTAEGEKAFRKAVKELVAKEVTAPEFTVLSYEELCKSMQKGFAEANPWEIMAEALEPFYKEK